MKERLRLTVEFILIEPRESFHFDILHVTQIVVGDQILSNSVTSSFNLLKWLWPILLSLVEAKIFRKENWEWRRKTTSYKSTRSSHCFVLFNLDALFKRFFVQTRIKPRAVYSYNTSVLKKWNSFLTMNLKEEYICLEYSSVIINYIKIISPTCICWHFN